MDWTGMLRESWRILRRTPTLWGLGAISALQLGVYTLIIMGLIVPMTLLTQALVVAGSAAASGGASSGLASALPAVVAGIQRWAPEMVAGIVAIIVGWAVLGVFDVAATVGAITQTSAVLDGGDVSVGLGMRDGFGVWWRTIGLLAIAALPSLVYLLAIALFTLFTISIPLSMGQAPNVAAITGGNAINSVLSSVVGIIGIPLAVLVNLGLRYVAVEGQEWRFAFSSAWKLARSRLADVALLYLLQAGIGIAAGLALGIVVGILAAIVGAVVALLVAAAHAFSGPAMFVTLLACLTAGLVLFVYSVAVIVWSSVLWTLFWRRLTGREAPVISPDYQAGVAASLTRQGEAL
ncbi:MAG: hypothetical protein P4L93_04970 [Coriobacteriia bacterium]|nr:hypothetical protein [Coriobacteriia bacterium]